MLLAREIYTSLTKLGFKVWFDVMMEDKSMDAMREGVERSGTVIAVMSGPFSNDDFPDDAPEDNAYLARWMCQQELR